MITTAFTVIVLAYFASVAVALAVSVVEVGSAS
jgi:hypothetical protein